ncbi:hypothetical protein Cpir12675_003862 [Ceratocystis pirilliformis]|uniref:Uncharacterized protein n=1 Tax=Ceratocystis pirilliformis TaxID=259994 RepID=A0ABR3Z0P2_9PEZI
MMFDDGATSSGKLHPPGNTTNLKEDIPNTSPSDIYAKGIPLNLNDGPSLPTEHRCIAHLRFLHALIELREEIGYTDGLWGICDSHAPKFLDVRPKRDETDQKRPWTSDVENSQTQRHKASLSLLREKRWSVYLARAVGRYEAWWNSMPKKHLTTDIMISKDGDSYYSRFPQQKDALVWTSDDMPPLDVLMVWHTHMLNPRDYLEDCMRAGHRSLWLAGFPWNLINQVINADFHLIGTAEARKNFESRTGHPWDNVESPMYYSLTCPIPKCNTKIHVPWTTCATEPDIEWKSTEPLVGSGYADGNFETTCPACKTKIDRKLLCLSKFIIDASNLSNRKYPMPGTVLYLVNGKPSCEKGPPETVKACHFPNVVVSAVFGKLPETFIEKEENRTMERVQLRLSIALRTNAIRNLTLERGLDSRSYQIRSKQLRKMMSRYHDNPSPFALDLVGAVVRQGVFAEKMQAIDWLHSPAIMSTMSSLILRYTRFMSLMSEPRDIMLVPTLDVDLAWHTAQLSPASYYGATAGSYGRFLDHDDKIDETKLSDGFEVTSKLYQERYQEVYSQCVCWYCEATRVQSVSSIAKMFGMSKQNQLIERFWSTNGPNDCPQNKAPHISSHSAVRVTTKRSNLHKVYQDRLDRQYAKARRRAAKNNRKLPPQDEYYNHWGTSYYMYGPYASPVYYHPGIYPCADVSSPVHVEVREAVAPVEQACLPV